MKKMMNGLVMVNFLNGAKEKDLMITEGRISDIATNWTYKWTSLYDFILELDGEIIIKSDEIETIKEKNGILVLSKYEKNVNMEIEIL
ncbi:MAG: hypothetical protein ACRCX8_06605 [Sarcina sp.]